MDVAAFFLVTFFDVSESVAMTSGSLSTRACTYVYSATMTPPKAHTAPMSICICCSVAVGALVPGIVLVGFSLGVSITAVTAIVLSDVPVADAGSAAGVQSTGLQLSSAVGIAVSGVAFFGAVGGRDGLQPYLDGLTWVMWVTLAFTAVQAGLAFLLPRHSAREAGELTFTDPELLVFPDLHAPDGVDG